MSNDKLKLGLDDIVALAVKEASRLPLNEVNQAVKSIYSIQQQIEEKLPNE